MVPIWTPYMQRHAALSRIRKEKGIEAAQLVGGHAAALMTEAYIGSADLELARRTAEVGLMVSGIKGE
jgi:hypothetical protein